MIDPARRIATAIGIDHAAALQRKIKRVIWLIWIVWMATFGLLPANALTLVLDQGSAFFNGGFCKHALAVNGGGANYNGSAIYLGQLRLTFFHASDVKIASNQCILFNEGAARVNLITHKGGEHLICHNRIFNLYTQ